MRNTLDQWKILAVILLIMEVVSSSAGQNMDRSRKHLLQVLESKNFFHMPLHKQDPPLMTKLISLYEDSIESINDTNGQNHTATGNSDYNKSQLPIIPYGLRMIKRALQSKKNGGHFVPNNEKYNRLSEKKFHLRDVLREIRNGIQGNEKMENGVKNGADVRDISVKEMELKSNSNATEGMSKNKRVIKIKDETVINLPQENGNKSFINMSAVTNEGNSTGDGPIILIFVLSIEGSLILSFLGVLGCVIAYYSRHRKAFQEKFKPGHKEEDDGINLELFEYRPSRNLDRNSSHPSKSFQAVRQEQRRRH
ncbi:uncharacterized protein [Palaemon carinicauda]|uniref:uncharacterized protein n=1 Tax=Palaemon carinicauda TaxID=392227 RepID=UPI0035B57A0A